MGTCISRFAGTMLACKMTVLFHPTAFAEKNPGESTELAPIVVSATRSEQSAVTTPASITTITRDEIEASGATNIAEVLRGRGGVQIRDLFGDGSRATVSMRGFGENAAANTLVLVDGRRLNNPDLAAPDLNVIALKDVERIEIIQGSAGTLFGDQAVGGVINVITRRPQRFSASIAGGLGSFDRRNLRAAISNHHENGLSYRFSGERRLTDNYRDHNQQDYVNAFGRLNYEHNSGTAFAEHQQIDEDLELPGALFATQVEADRRQSTNPTQFTETRTEVSRIGIEQSLHPDWYVRAEYTHRRSDGDGNLSGTAFSQNRRVRELTPRLIGTLGSRHGEVLLTFGLDYVQSDYEITSLFGSTENDQRVRNVYAQAVVPVSRRATVTVGARNARVENDLTDAFAFPAGVELDDSETVGELGLSFQVDPQWRVFARRDGNFRFAKVDEHTFTPPGIIGLDTQTGVSYELGAEWKRGAQRIKALAYRLKLDNEINFDPSVGFFGANTNLEETTRDGLIVEAYLQPVRRLSLNAQYSYVDAEFDNGTFDGNAIPFVAEHTFRASARFRFDAHWSLFGELHCVGERVPAGDFANTLQELDGYTVTNVNLSYRHERWLASLRINNVTDREYSDFAVRGFNPFPVAATAFYPAPERNVLLTLRYELE